MLNPPPKDPEAWSELAQNIVLLVKTLNSKPQYDFPRGFIDVTDQSSRLLGRHDQQTGKGNDREAEASDAAGSALMLAALFPKVYGVETAPPLRIFGTPPPQCLAVISSIRSKSGRGADNRRHNVWEALLNHWQNE